MVTFPYQDVAACTVARYRTRFCANLPASFVVYPSLSLMQSSHLLLCLRRDLLPGTCPSSTAFSKEFYFPPIFGVQQPSFWNFKLISNRSFVNAIRKTDQHTSYFVEFKSMMRLCLTAFLLSLKQNRNPSLNCPKKQN